MTNESNTDTGGDHHSAAGNTQKNSDRDETWTASQEALQAGIARDDTLEPLAFAWPDDRMESEERKTCTEMTEGSQDETYITEVIGDSASIMKERLQSLTESALDLQGKVEAGLNLGPSHIYLRRRRPAKYKKSLKMLLPVRGKSPKDTLPLSSIGCLNFMTFGWVTPIMIQVYRNGVDYVKSLQLSQEDNAETSAMRLERLWREELEAKGPEKASFKRVMIRAIRTRLICTFFFLSLFVLFSMLNPMFLIRSFLEYLARGNLDIKVGFIYVLGILCCELMRAGSISMAWMNNYKTGVRERASAMTLLFAKITRLKGMKNKSVGELVNMVGNDGQRIFDAIVIGPLVLTGPLAMTAGCIYSVYYLGPWALVGCAVFVSFYPFSTFISRLTTFFRRKGIFITDRRVRMMNELLSCIKLIKMYAWEKPFAKKIAEIRLEEQKVLERSAIVQSISTGVAVMVPVIASSLTFIAMVSADNDLTAAQAFTFVALLNSMRFVLGVLPYGVKSLAEVSVALKRYQSILLMEEMQPRRDTTTKNNIAIEVNDATLSWGVVDDTPYSTIGSTSEAASVIRNDENRSSKQKNDEKLKMLSTEEKNVLMVKKSAEHEATLHNITFSLEKGRVLGVCGSVGSGKSSLINAVLGRMEQISGSVAIQGSIAYVSQQPWIINDTARENILFGLPYNEERYNSIVEACALKQDFETFVSGDLTEIGERGINLSGGQKQRISLARAVYSDSDVYLLDDPLSAVDVHVGRHIFSQCIMKALKGKTILFVTHQLQYLNQCDSILFLKDGHIMEQGNHSELMAQNGEYAGLMQIYYSEQGNHVITEGVNDEKVESISCSQSPGIEQLFSTISIASGRLGLERFVSSSGSCHSGVQGHVLLERAFSISSTTSKTTELTCSEKVEAVSSSRSPGIEQLYSTISIASGKLGLERVVSSSGSCQSGVQGHVLLERAFSISSAASRTIEHSGSETKENAGKLTIAEEPMKGGLDKAVILSYIKASGGYCVAFVVLLAFFLTVASQNAANLFLTYWLNQGSGNTSITVDNQTFVSPSIADHPEKSMFTLLYGLIIVVMVVLLLVRAYIFMKATLRASSRLHDEVFEKILRCPMSFFDMTPLGRIINRFSSDIDEVDVRLPMNSETFISNIMHVFFSLALISYVAPYFLIALLPLLVIFIIIYKIFSRNMRDLKRLDMVLRSPLLSHITATVQGISTIHAYRKTDDFLKKFCKLLNANSVPFVLFFISNRWLALRLDLISAMVTSITALIIVLTYETITPAMAGLALSSALQMTGLFQFTVRLAIESEARFTSVQRILDYSKTIKPEAPPIISDKRPPMNWPKHGGVEFKNVQMRYRDNLPLCLKGLTFTIKPQEKIGIVGRSGAGKSSLGVVLFRLVEMSGGKITIDDIDISTIGLEDLRSKLSIIPQDPVLFVGTIRYNLDPFQQHTDEELWSCLEKCHMKEMIACLDQQLESPVIENGENFSVGERQLLCMARALLRHSKILILDEATAAIDTETDALVQATLKEAFGDCTMLIIAHRLNTVLSCDKILVIADGKVAEYDRPSTLMANPDSLFQSMLRATEGTELDYR